MFDPNRLRVRLGAALALVPIALAPSAAAEPPPPADPMAQPVADVGPPPDTGVVASEAPVVAQTPDGRTLTVAAKDETQLPIAPLTTALSSRAWLVGATFTGEVTGDVNGGTLEVGYQIGCGILLDKGVKLTGSVGVAFGGFGIATPQGDFADGVVGFPINGGIEVFPRPGEVTNVTVDKKTFKGTTTRVTVKDIQIKVDGCVGASSLRSYAILTSSDTDTDDIVAYYGIPKVF